MKKTIVAALVLVSTFFLGFAVRAVTDNKPAETSLKRVTGIGGIFFKCKDPKKLREWYKIHLGLNTNQYGCVFEWYQGADSTQKGFTQWSPFTETTKYFNPSTKDYMINYRVTDMDALVIQLRLEGVTILDSVETYDYGKFVHIQDLEGNKLELWQPNDVVYEKMGKEMNMPTTK
jgi:predicted enzyme related to lactoylglutathione lyase